MNGDSMAQMIKSCCPNIKDPWVIPLTDLDPILIAIRLASYGGDLDLTSNCTHCNEENEHTIKLSVVLDSLTPTSMFDQSHLIDGLIFELKPQQFKELNVVGQITFEQRKLISAIENGDLGDEEKKALFYQSFKRLTDLNIGTLVSCIKSITTEDGTIVNESAVIKDFLINADRGTYEEIKNTVKYKYENYVGDLEKQTYISKIGIYDENKNLIAIAKLARPIKKSENRSLTFKLKLDI
jgi:hypothetical protein